MASQNAHRTLVTGGFGFLGYHVCHELLQHGHSVYVLDTCPLRHDIPVSAYYQLDLRDAVAVRHVVRDCHPDIVIHLAAIHYIPYCNEHPLETIAVNVRGTLNLLAALEECGVQYILASSSADVYSHSAAPHKEAEPCWPQSIYGFTKRAMELVIQEWGERLGARNHIVRYFNMYGWGETTPHLIPALIQQVSQGKNDILLGNTHPYRDFIHVTDAASATRILAETCLMNTVVNVGSGASYSADNLVNILGRLTARQLNIVTDASRVRATDRPYLIADLSWYKMLELPTPKYTMDTGLRELLKTGLGPYLGDKT